MRLLAALTALFLLLAGPIWAAPSFKDRIVAQLQRQGFQEMSISRTLLGRTRIVAENTTHRREIVFTANGVILRDYWILLKSGEGGSFGLVNPSESRDDDDDDDDDDDVDNSGKGSDNSGSGSGNSGSGGGNSGPGGGN